MIWGIILAVAGAVMAVENTRKPKGSPHRELFRWSGLAAFLIGIIFAI